MKKLILAMFTSIDGYIEGPNGEFVPPPWSAEVREAWAEHNLAHAGHLIYGRVNFQFNKGHWTSQAAAGQRETATMNRLPKTVVSRTLSGDPGWNGTLASRDLGSVVATLKRTVSNGDIYCFGGAGLAKGLMLENLVDEYYLMLMPKVLGGGKRLFDAGIPRIDLKLLEARRLDVGSIILHYGRVND
jgi:dihydrofolate reductase